MLHNASRITIASVSFKTQLIDLREREIPITIQLSWMCFVRPVVKRGRGRTRGEAWEAMAKDYGYRGNTSPS